LLLSSLNTFWNFHRSLNILLLHHFNGRINFHYISDAICELYLLLMNNTVRKIRELVHLHTFSRVNLWFITAFEFDILNHLSSIHRAAVITILPLPVFFFFWHSIKPLSSRWLENSSSLLNTHFFTFKNIFDMGVFYFI
jgi:hypothetical protein